MINWKTISQQLKTDDSYKVNMELAAKIVENQPRSVHYYLTVIGNPIMQHIESHILHRNVTADYYLFLSSPFDNEKEVPLWHKVSLYKGINCRLDSYTSCITCRHFCKVAKQELVHNSKNNEMLEYVDYETLLGYDHTLDEESEQIQLMRQAFSTLSERDQEVLRCLVIQNMPSIDAYPQLEKFVTPRSKDGMSPDEVKAQWSVKQRQDALALMKGRALIHLQKRLREINKNNV